MNLNIYTLTFTCSEVTEADGIWEHLCLKAISSPFAPFERPQPLTITIKLSEFGFARALAALSMALMEHLRESVTAGALAHAPLVVPSPSPDPSLPKTIGLSPDTTTTIRKRGRPRKQLDQQETQEPATGMVEHRTQ